MAYVVTHLPPQELDNPILSIEGQRLSYLQIAEHYGESVTKIVHASQSPGSIDSPRLREYLQAKVEAGAGGHFGGLFCSLFSATMSILPALFILIGAAIWTAILVKKAESVNTMRLAQSIMSGMGMEYTSVGSLLERLSAT